MSTAPSQIVNQSELNRFFAYIGSLGGHPKACAPSVHALAEFFSSANALIVLAEKKQGPNKKYASRFNVFDFIDPDENKISDVLAMLLDPQGKHGQGNIFLRLLFRQLGLPANDKHLASAIVRREACTHSIMKSRRRIDVLIDAGTLVAIENKIDALEQEDQVKDYLAHLGACARPRSIRHALIYLTPTGRPPDSLHSAVVMRHRECGQLHCWGYQTQLRTWLDACLRECVTPKIRNFLSDFIAYIESELRREIEVTTEEELNEDED